MIVKLEIYSKIFKINMSKKRQTTKIRLLEGDYGDHIHWEDFHLQKGSQFLN